MTSQAFREAFFAAETDETTLILITITHADMPVTVRLVANSDDVVSRGDMYLGYPVEITWPGSGEDQQPQARVKIGSVYDPEHPENDIVLILRNLGGKTPNISFEVVLASDPDTVEMAAPDMILSTVDFDGSTIEGELIYVNVLMEPYPGDTYSPSDWPGVHA